MSSHARISCSWPRSAAVTAWASRHITMYLTQQLTPYVQDAVMVRTLWNTGFWSALRPSQQEETSLVKWVCRWKSWRIIQERQCWCLGAPCRAAICSAALTCSESDPCSNRLVNRVIIITIALMLYNVASVCRIWRRLCIVAKQCVLEQTLLSTLWQGHMTSSVTWKLDSQ